MKTIQSTPIAVVGMGGIFPAAPDIDTLWNNIINKIGSVCDVPENRWITDTGSLLTEERLVDSSRLPDGRYTLLFYGRIHHSLANSAVASWSPFVGMTRCTSATGLYFIWTIWPFWSCFPYGV